MQIKNDAVVTFGEMLWDIFPNGRQAGGAPMNVAIHLGQLGIPARHISKIGLDAAGDDLLGFLNSHSVNCDLIERDEKWPTGSVAVQFDENKSPVYDIMKLVAWDNIRIKEDMRKAVREAACFVYGTLAARSGESRRTLHTLLEISGVNVLDMNLRPPFADRQILEPLLLEADILKLNAGELAQVCQWKAIMVQSMDAQIEKLFRQLNLRLLLVTLGKAGAVGYDGKKYYRHPGFPVKGKDSVGAGDAFLAGFLSVFLPHKDIPRALKRACAMGAMVAAQTGATPLIRPQDIEKFIQKNATSK